MRLNKFSLLKYALLIPIIYFIYLTVFDIPFLPSFGLQNWVIVIILIILEIPVINIERKMKKAEVQANIKDGNPWEVPKKPSNDDSFGNFLKSRVESFGMKSEGAAKAFRRTNLPFRVFLKAKRICYGILCVFYVALALTSFSNPIFLVLFLITAYAFLENVLWSRHYQWSRKKKNES